MSAPHDLDPEPAAPWATPGVLCSDFRWLHLPLPRGRRLDELRPGADFRCADVLAEWLCESAGAHLVELRLGSSGAHAGVWLGLAGVGATAAQAFQRGLDGWGVLQDAALDFGWSAAPAMAPRLPTASVGLSYDEGALRLEGLGRLSETRRALSDVPHPGAPVVLCVRFDLSAARPELVRDAMRLRVLASGRMGTGDPMADRAPAAQGLAASGRALDEGASARISVRLHARRLPGALPLRMLAAAFEEDAGTCVRWTPVAPLLDVSYLALPWLLEQISATLPGAGQDDDDDDDIPF